MRAAAATAKQALLSLASANLGVPVASLSVDKGVVSGGGKTVTYGQLVGGQALQRHDPPDRATQRHGRVSVPPPRRYGAGSPRGEARSISTRSSRSRIPRVDVPGIVTATLAYSNDVRLPGMLHGRVVRPRGQSSLVNARTNLTALFGFGVVGTNYTLELLAGGGQAPVAIDESSIKHIAGAQVVHVGNFVGVVAPTEWGAIQAAAELKVTWEAPASPLPGNGNLAGALREPAPQPTPPLLITEMGDVDAGLAQAAKTVSGDLQDLLPCPRPDRAARCGRRRNADRGDDHPPVSGQLQPCGRMRRRDARAAATSVREISFQGSSIYGGISTDLDCAAAAALLSKNVGKPVRVQFMRWDEHGFDNYDAAEVIDVRAGIDASGKIIAFDYVANSPLGIAQPPAAWNTGGVYLIPNRSVVKNTGPQFLQTAPLRSPMDRGPALATEQTIDELAYAAGSDPLEFRRQNMTGNDTWLAALEAVASAAKWKPRPAAAKLSDANVVTGRGFGFGTHVLGGGLQGPGLDFRTLDPTTPAATIAEIEVNKKTGKITVKHVYAAIAPGFVVNPGRVADQVIGTAVMGTSQALLEEVTFNTSNVTSLDWVTYPSLRFKDHPNVTPIVIQQLDALPGGAGEEPISAMFPAIANAFFDATGVRLRQVPMTPAVVRNALARAGVK